MVDMLDLGCKLVLAPYSLTNWGRVAHIFVSKLTIIGSDNGLWLGRYHALIWSSDGVLLISPLGTIFSEILIGNQTISFKKMHLKMSSAKWRPFCLALNVLYAICPWSVVGTLNWSIMETFRNLYFSSFVVERSLMYFGLILSIHL